jgi:hypothetical protein
MLPGPDLVRDFRGAERPSSNRTLMSGNPFGARYWTGGRTEAPMLPETPPRVKCPWQGAIRAAIEAEIHEAEIEDLEQ